MKNNICIFFKGEMFKKHNKIVDLDDLTEKKYLMREFKQFIGYLELSDSYVENGMREKFKDFVDKKIGKEEKNNRYSRKDV